MENRSIQGYYSITIKIITIIIVGFVVVAVFTCHMCLRFICGVQKQCVKELRTIYILHLFIALKLTQLLFHF
jgi:hypothetical protein